MPFVPFKKKGSADSSTAAPASADVSKKFSKKRGKGRRAPAQKALTSPGRSMSGGGR